jgi:Protein of unknown function (DUF1570)
MLFHSYEKETVAHQKLSWDTGEHLWRECFSLMRLFSWFLGGILVCAVVPAGAKEKTWVQVRSSHCTVVTDLGEERGIEAALHCEQMRAAFHLLMNKAKTDDATPLLIFALDGEKEVDRLLGRPKAKHTGLFLPGRGKNFILVDASADPRHAVYHEYIHELLKANSSSAVPTWFEEGFAEYFSTAQVDVKGTKLGLVPIGELQFLRQNGKLMRLSDLFAVRQDSKLYNQNGPTQAMFYAESWLLVHYIFDHNLISHAEPLFSRVASGQPLSIAIPAEFGVSMTQLESDLLEYAKGERFRFFSLPAVEVSDAIAVMNLSPITVRALRSDLQWHASTRHSKQEVSAHLEEMRSLLKQEPNNSTVLQLLAPTPVDEQAAEISAGKK